MWRDFMPKFEVALFEQAARAHRRIWAVNILGRPFEEDRDGSQIVNALSRRDRLVSRREFAGVVVDLYEAASEGANAR